MTAYTEKDANRMTWREFDTLIDTLIQKIKMHFGASGRIDVVSQLHRTGGIVGSVLAIKMGIIPLLPLQFKYSYNPKRLDQIISVPDILVAVPEDMRILLAEGNTSSGSAATRATEVIHQKYPKAKVYLATLTKVYGGPEQLAGIEKIFYGTLTNENFKASPEEAQRLHIRDGVTVFPWENTKSELADINGLDRP